MIEVYFYNITKRLNSTARPTGTGTKYDCYFKETTSLLNPSLTLQLSSKPDYNYFKFDNRYYWITDITSLNNNRWLISGNIDVLATYKGHIQATSAFVLYDSTANTQLPDMRLGMETDCEVYTSTAQMPWSYSSGTGDYFICTTGVKDDFNWDDGTTVADAYAGTGVYIIPKTSIEQLGYDGHDFLVLLFRYLNTWLGDMSTDLGRIITPVTDPLEWVKNGFYGFAYMFRDTTEYVGNCFRLLFQNIFGGGTALSNIKACYWLPFVTPGGNGEYTAVTKPLALGTYKDLVTGLKLVNKPIITSLGIDVTIPWQFSDWRNVSCTEVALYIPLIGCINIPSEVVKGHDTLTITISLNLYSGAMAVEVTCGGAQIGTYGAQVAMPYLIGDSNINMSSMVNTVTNAVAKNYGGAIISGAQTITEMATSVGGIGGGAGTGLTDKIVCICRVHNTSQEPSALLSTIGTPTNQLKTLSGSGFCQCLNAQMNCGAITGEPYPTRTEIETVNNFLNTGVYLE